MAQRKTATSKSSAASKSKQVETATDRVLALFESDDDTITAEQLASAVERTGKVTRAQLRKAHTRSADAKNSSWRIDKSTALEMAEWSESAKRIERTA